MASTTFPHYPQWKWQAPVAWWHHREHLHGVDVRRKRVVLPRRPTIAWRLAYDTSFAAVSLLDIAAAQRPDIVVCISPPIQAALASGLLARRWRVPLVLLVKDLPLQAALSVGMMRAGTAYRVGEWLERRAYSLADRIVVISQRFSHRLAEQRVQGSKVVEIPDWADLDDITPQSAEEEVRKLLGGSREEFIVLHTGNMGEKQGLGSAVRAAKLVAQQGKVRLTLVGDGPQRRSLERMVANEGIQAVTLLPLQPASVFPRMLAAADLLLLNQRADVQDSVVPSKLLAYMAAGRPILTAAHPGSVAAQMVRDAGCGLVIRPEDPAALAEAIRDLSQDPGRRKAFGVAARSFVAKNFDKRGILSRWDSLLAELYVSRRHGSAAGTLHETR